MRADVAHVADDARHHRNVLVARQAEHIAVIAHDRRVAVGTVRSQIRRILEKSGSSSQLEFAARLHRY